MHVIIAFIGFKITFCNIRSHGAPLSQTLGLKGLKPKLRLSFLMMEILCCKNVPVSMSTLDEYISGYNPDHLVAMKKPDLVADQIVP